MYAVCCVRAREYILFIYIYIYLLCSKPPPSFFFFFLRPGSKRNLDPPMYVNTGANKQSKQKRDHFTEYILEDNALKKVPRHALGSIQTIRGEWRSISTIIHFQNDKIPEPLDNIHTFQIQFPTPGIVNWVPTSDTDYLVLPRVRDFSFRVIHDTVAVPVPGSATKIPELRTKSVALWASTESVKHYQEANPNFVVTDIKDLQMKYQPRGLLHYRLKSQRVSVNENQDYKLAGLDDKIDTDAQTYTKMISVPQKRPAADSSGTHLFTFNMDYEPTPNLVTPITWDRETGQCYGDSCYVHMWLENGVWDAESTVYFEVKWSLEKVTAKDMWYHENALETRKKLIASGAFLKQEIDALKEKEQIFYTVTDQVGDHAYKYFAWKSYIEEGRFVQHLNPGIKEDTTQEGSDQLNLSTITAAHPEWVGTSVGGAHIGIRLPQETNPDVPFPPASLEGKDTVRSAVMEASDTDPDKVEKLTEGGGAVTTR